MRPEIIASIAVTLMACTNEKRNEHSLSSKVSLSTIDQARWLLGTWYTQTRSGVNYEVWKAVDDTTFGGTSFSVRDADTVLLENIRLVESNGKLAYIPIVPDQNSGLPVVFELTSIDSSQMVFENSKHDFPQKITYQQISNDSLVAEISGILDGQSRSRRFPMKRQVQH